MPDANDVALAALFPSQPVVDRGSHQEDRCEGCQNETDEEDDPAAVADLVEMGRKRHGEQEGEQHLGSREHDPQLAQELHQLPVCPRLLGLLAALGGPVRAPFLEGRRSKPCAASGGRAVAHFLLFVAFFFFVRVSTRLAFATIFS